MAKILIADDSATDLQYITHTLKGIGHELITAIDGEEAENKIRSEQIDLVVLDVIMPKKNGFQVCRNLKSDDRYRKIPVILLTSKKQESDIFWGKKQGADEYITKPFEPFVLITAIKKHLMK